MVKDPVNSAFMVKRSATELVAAKRELVAKLLAYDDHFGSFGT